MEIKDRIIQFINYLGMNTRQFERSIGASNGYINSMRKGAGLRKIEQILSSYPQLSRTWLLTGEGDMIKEPENTDENIDATISYRIAEIIKDTGESVNSFAKRSGIPQTTLSAAINRNSAVTSNLLRLLVEANPNVSSEWLLTGHGQKYKNEIHVANQIEEYKSEIKRLKEMLNARKSTKLVVELDIDGDEFVKMGLKDKIVQVLKLK